jgi:hypothetical protein
LYSLPHSREYVIQELDLFPVQGERIERHLLDWVRKEDLFSFTKQSVSYLFRHVHAVSGVVSGILENNRLELNWGIPGKT